MNKSVIDALATGVYSLANNRIDYKSIFGWKSINRFSALTSEEVSALAAKFGDDIIAKIGIIADQAGAEKIAAEKAANHAASLARDAAKVRVTRDRDTDGDGFADGLRNCVGL